MILPIADLVFFTNALFHKLIFKTLMNVYRGSVVRFFWQIIICIAIG